MDRPRVTRPVGRPHKLTNELMNKICDAIKAGNYIETAAAYAGIDKTTLYDWMKRGANEKTGIFADFSNAVEKALAESEMRDVLLIGKAANENWQAAAWRLERKFSDRWGRKDRTKIVFVDPKTLSDKELKELIDNGS